MTWNVVLLSCACSVCEAIINSAVGAELKKAMAVAVGATAARLRKKLHRQFVLVPVRGNGGPEQHMHEP